MQHGPLLVDGVKWTPQPGGVTGCYHARDASGVASKNPHIKWPRRLLKDPALAKNLINYFYMMFPDMIESIYQGVVLVIGMNQDCCTSPSAL